MEQLNVFALCSSMLVTSLWGCELVVSVGGLARVDFVSDILSFKFYRFSNALEKRFNNVLWMLSKIN